MTLLADDAAAQASAKAAADAAAATPEAKAAAEKAAADAAASTPEAKAAAEKAAADKAAADAAAAAATPEGKAAAEKAAAEKAVADKAKGAAPEKYEFKAPEGVEFDKEVLTELEAIAKELKLPQDKAQAFADLGVKVMQKQSATLKASIEKIHSDWIESSKSDKEFGGAEFEKNLAVAKLGMEGETPELVKMLNETGLGNHPEMLRHFFRIGKTRAQDKLVKGKEAAGQASGALTYAKSNHV